MSIGTFMLIRDEHPWIAAHLLNVLPFIDEMVFLDGNSTDGTLEIIEHIRDNHEHGSKILLIKGQDPKNLQDDYVRLFNDALHKLNTDWAFFLHPDMWIADPSHLREVANMGGICLATRVTSFAGEPGGQLYEIDGRGKYWKNIYRLNNPNLGAHYFGSYGETAEDVYFSSITGKEHCFYDDFKNYPYPILQSGLEILHFSDVRPYERRHSRMMKCLENNRWPKDKALERAATHPRVTLKDDGQYRFIPREYPLAMTEAREKYKHLEKEPKCLPVFHSSSPSISPI